MQEIFNFFICNWQVIISVLSLVFAFILLLIKKKPVISYLAYIFNVCLTSVKLVEDLCKKEAPELKGKDKLDLCVDYVIGALKEAYPGIEASRYKQTIIATIEAILSTPQKKGE